MSTTLAPSPTITWPQPERRTAFEHWLAALAGPQQLDRQSLQPASMDASFRRYFRIQSPQGTRIIMDAPPEHENCQPFAQVAELMAQAGLRVPQILDWDATQGFMLLSDLGEHTLLQHLESANVTPQATQALYLQAVDTLVQWQQASKPGVLPAYDSALLHRELSLFPTWYLTQYRGLAPESFMPTLQPVLDTLVTHNLQSASVYVHRDFMPRNLMVAPTEQQPAALGVLDFQDAVYGPISYDIASLMRDAFLSWDEEFVLDITVRYWQKARAADLPVPTDFSDFYRAVEWMGLQRHLKVLGIFARLTLRDGKPKYLADTPRFIQYVRHTATRYRALGPLLALLDQAEGSAPAESTWVIGR